jgi:hypothetical protein
MPAKKRARYMMIGSLIAALSLFIPDFYSIDYQGPPLPAGVNLSGVIGDFSAISGPYDAKPLLGSLILLFILGFSTRYLKFDYEIAWKNLSKTAKYLNIGHHGVGLGANAFGLWSFFWQFNHNGIPDSVRDTFITRAGGTAEAKAQTAYLFPSLGGYTLLLIIVAMGIVLIGTLPLFFAIVGGLAVAFVAATLLATGIGLYLPWVDTFQAISTANGQRPFTTGGPCVLTPGVDSNCESPNPALTVQLPNLAPATPGCTYTITIDWGDHATPRTATVTKPTGPTLLTAQHTYGSVNAYVLTVTETVTAGRCTANPASWRPEFAIGVTH